MNKTGVDIKLRKQVSMAVLLILIVLFTAGLFNCFLADMQAPAGNASQQARVLAGEFGFNAEATIPETAPNSLVRRNGSERGAELMLGAAFSTFVVLAHFLLNRKALGTCTLLHLLFRYHNSVLYIAFPVGQHAPPSSSRKMAKLREMAIFGIAPLQCVAGLPA